MAEVVGLRGSTTKGNAPNAAVIECLEQLLYRAQTGHIQQLAFVAIDDGVPIDGYSPGALPGELFMVIAGLEVCKATLLAQMV